MEKQPTDYQNFRYKSLIKETNIPDKNLIDNNTSQTVKKHQHISQLRDFSYLFELFSPQTESGIWAWHLSSEIIYFDNYCSEIFGCSKDSVDYLTQNDWFDTIHPEDRTKVHILLDKILSGNNTSFSYECRVKGVNGQWIRILDRGSSFGEKYPNKPNYIFGFRTNISNKVAPELQTSSVIDKHHNSFSLDQLNRLAAIAENYLDNMLTHILDQTFFIKQRINPHSGLNRNISLIEESTKKAKEITSLFIDGVQDYKNLHGINNIECKYNPEVDALYKSTCNENSSKDNNLNIYK